MTQDDERQRRIEQLTPGLNLRGHWGEIIRYSYRGELAAPEFNQIAAALEGIDASQSDEDALRRDIAGRLEFAGLAFVADPPTKKGTRIDFVVGHVGIVVDTGGSGTRTAQRLRDIDPARRLIGTVVVGPCGLKGKQPRSPMLVIEPRWEEKAE